MAARDFEKLAQRAADENSIIATISRLAQAQDDLDFAAYCRCFTEKVLLHATVIIPNWPGGEIAVEKLARRTCDILSRFDAVHHMVFNHVIEIDGDEASCIADLNSVSILEEGGDKQVLTIGGRYTLKLVRVDDVWRISERTIRPRYQHGDPAILEKTAARSPVRAVINE